MCREATFTFSRVYFTCWRELAPFERIGAQLKKYYDRALEARVVDNKIQVRWGDHFTSIADARIQRFNWPALLYLDRSTGYCVGDNATGTKELMLRRTCRSDDADTTNCEFFKYRCFSCDLRYKTEEHYEQVKCECKFVWCCRFQCNTCMRKYFITKCTP